MKKIKKIHKKLERKVHKFLRRDPNAGVLLDIVFILLIAFAFSFTSLVYLASRNVNPQNVYNITYSNPSAFEKKIDNTVEGYPIEKMTPYIAQKDKRVAIYLVAIAKKESNWGKFSPKKDGRECWNFWGYRGPENPTDSGYSCFDSPRQAVQVVGNRINDFLEQDINTPQEMAVWKCGFNCSWDKPEAVEKWVSDVGYYYKKLYE